MEGITVIEVDPAALMVPDVGAKVNQLGVVEPTPVNVRGFDVRLEIAKDCGTGVAPGAGKNSRPFGVTAGGAVAPAGTMLKTIAIDIGGCLPSVGVSVTAP